MADIKIGHTIIISYNRIPQNQGFMFCPLGKLFTDKLKIKDDI
jgi:hypothetical protein